MSLSPVPVRTSDELQYSEADARSLVRLLGEVCSQADDHALRKTFLMDGLCELLGANGWASSLTVGAPKADSGGLRKLSFLNTDLDGLASEFPTVERLGPPEQSALGRLQAVGPLILSAWSGGDGVSVFVIHRSVGSPLFTSREAGLAEIVLSEVCWLHDADWKETRPNTQPALPPRECIVLHLLLKGENRKGIADRLSISVNTVSGYARELYRKIGVSSQAELMRRFAAGELQTSAVVGSDVKPAESNSVTNSPSKVAEELEGVVDGDG